MRKEESIVIGGVVYHRRKIASYDPRQGGWVVWDRKLMIVRSYHAGKRHAAEETASQGELDV